MATYTSVKNGNWSDPLTWGSASYPSISGDIVDIRHEVIYDINSSIQMGTVTINGGILDFSRSMNTRLAMGNYDLEIGGYLTAGVLKIGDTNNPIPKEYTAILEFNPSSDASKGITINNSIDYSHIVFYERYFRLVGDPDYYGSIISTTLTSNWTSGKIFTVSGNLVSKWKIGQEIIMNAYSMATYVGSPVSTHTRQFTIANITLNGENTDIEVVEDFSIPFNLGAHVINISRNVIVRKVNAVTTLENYNTLRPRLYGNNWSFSSEYHDVTNVMFVGMADMSGFRNNVIPGNDWNGCVWRNGESALTYTTGMTDRYMTKLYNCVVVSCKYGVSWCQGRGVYIDNSIFIANKYAIYECNSLVVTNSKFITNGGTVHISDLIEIYDSDFIENAWNFWLCYAGVYVQNCMFVKNYELADQVTLHFNRCYIGYNRNGELTDTQFSINTERIIDSRATKVIIEDSMWLPSLSYSYLYPSLTEKSTSIQWKNAIINEDGYPAITDRLKLVNALSLPNQGGATFLSLYKQDTTEKYSGDSSKMHFFDLVVSKITRTLSEYKKDDYLDIIEYDVPAAPQQRKIYVKFTERYSTGTIFTADDFYLEAEYYNGSGSMSSTTIVKSSQDLIKDEWVALTVNFTPAKIGNVRYRIKQTKNFSTNPYPMDSRFYIDSAIWISDTEYIKLRWDKGDFIKSFSRSDFPLESNVRKDIVYNDGQFSGELTIPSISDVREGVEYDAYSVGILDLPIESDVLKDVKYDNETKTGTRQFEYYGNLITVEVEYD